MIATQLSPLQAEQAVYNAARENGATDALAKVITAQSGHETSGWTSNVWLTDNNGFGYGYQGGGVYKVYDSIEDSVADLYQYLKRRVAEGRFPDLGTITDPDAYAAALKAVGYFTDNLSTYSNGLERWYNDNLQLVAGGGVAIVIGAALLLYFLSKKSA